MILDKLKKIFLKEEEKDYGVPNEHMRVRWKKSANLMGLDGDMAKEVDINSEKKTVPYSKHYVEARKENFNSPVLDTTEGRSSPEVGIERKINPGKLEWEE